MNYGAFGVGIFLILVGGAGFYYLEAVLIDCGSIFGQLEQFFSQSLIAKCKIVAWLDPLSFGALVGGIVTFFLSFLAKPWPK